MADKSQFQGVGVCPYQPDGAGRLLITPECLRTVKLLFDRISQNARADECEEPCGKPPINFLMQ